MLQLTQHDTSDSIKPAAEEVIVRVNGHEVAPSTVCTSIDKSPCSNAYVDSSHSSWNDDQCERQFLVSSIKAEQEYYARPLNASSLTQPSANFHVSELSPGSIVSPCSSTFVEREVFNDIIASIPKTAKSIT
ncbi:hypothetical protein ACUV84_040369, partial [Puccinellia chinampoensis]